MQDKTNDSPFSLPDNSTDNPFPPRGICKPKNLPEEYGLNRVSAWRLEKSDPDFPKHVPMTETAIGFFRHELDWYYARRRQRAQLENTPN